MKTVKTFGNLAEAGFASSLLEAAGIPASLADEQSFLMVGGMGMLGIRLQVEDADFERAAQVLAKGPDADVPTADDLPVLPEKREEPGRIPAALFFVAGAIFALMVFSVRQAAERRTGPMRAADQTYDYDYNHDGRPDHFLIYRSDVISRAEVDRNADGKIDEWETYDRDGTLERAELDDNFDGRPDAWSLYKNGMIESSRHDTNFDGRPDWFAIYENGMVARMDCRPNVSGVVVRRYIYGHGVLREEWVDENLDGIFDCKFLFDPFGVKSERIPIPPAK